MINIILNTNFLKSSVAIQKSAKGLCRDWLACVYIMDTDTDRIYYCTDGHTLIYLKEPIEHKQLNGAIALSFEKFPKVKKDFVDVNLMETGEALIHTGKDTVVVQYADNDHIYKEKFDSIQQLLNEKEIEKFSHPTEQFVCFDPELLQICYNFMGMSMYCTRPLSKDEQLQQMSPVLWANTDKSQCCLVMPMRLGER